MNIKQAIKNAKTNKKEIRKNEMAIFIPAIQKAIKVTILEIETKEKELKELCEYLAIAENKEVTNIRKKHNHQQIRNDVVQYLQTVELKPLIDDGIIEKLGGGPSTVYRLKTIEMLEAV